VLLGLCKRVSRKEALEGAQWKTAKEPMVERSFLED
jgi:hypothetical protein